MNWQTVLLIAHGLLAVALLGAKTRVFRYPLPKGKPVKSVETECRLQREKS